jgi:hypothetical protein
MSPDNRHLILSEGARGIRIGGGEKKQKGRTRLGSEIENLLQVICGEDTNSGRTTKFNNSKSALSGKGEGAES